MQQTEIRHKLTRLRKVLRARLACEGLAWLMLAWVALVVVTLGFDYTLHLDLMQRGLILGLCGLGVLYTFWRKLLGPMLVPVTDESLAILVEEKFGKFAGRLIGALQLAGRSTDELAGMSQAMVGKMAGQAEQIARGLKFTDVIETRRLRKFLTAAGVALMLVVAFWLIAPGVMNMWFQRNILLRDINWPQRTYLSVWAMDSAGRIQLLMPGHAQAESQSIKDVEVLRGADLQIIAFASGKAPHVVTLRAEYPSVGETEENLSPESIGSWREKIEQFQSAAGKSKLPEIGFAKKFQAVSEEFSFYITGGDDNRGKASFRSRVKLVDPPALQELAFTVEYPPYMRRDKSETLTGDRGVLPLPRGASVELIASASKPLRQAEIMLDDKPIGQIKIVDGSTGPGRVLRGFFKIPAKYPLPTATLKIRLLDTQGYSNPRGEKYVVHLLPDAAPEVMLHSSGVRHVIAPSATIPLQAIARDDNGVDSIRLMWTAQPVELTTTAPTTQPGGMIGQPIQATGSEVRQKLQGQRMWDIQPMKFTPGTKLQVHAEATDFLPADYGGPNNSSSRAISFEVIPAEKLLGQLVGLQKEVRMEFFQAMGQQTLAQGRCQSVAEEPEKIGEETLRKLSESAGGQRQVASESAKAAATLQAVAIELELNRLGKAEQYEAIRTEIVQPLRKLVEQMRSVAIELDQAREIKTAAQLADKARQIAEQQAQILRKMEEIIKHMQKLENRLELARQLEGLLKMSVELNAILRKRVEAGTDVMFDPVEPEK